MEALLGRVWCKRPIYFVPLARFRPNVLEKYASAHRSSRASYLELFDQRRVFTAEVLRARSKKKRFYKIVFGVLFITSAYSASLR
jgi:hypothetical protein